LQIPQPIGKSIVVTGASSGFGRATAMWMLAEGWQVFAMVRKAADQDALVDDAEKAGWAERLTVVICDITRAEDVRALADAVATKTGRLDALVNNAGGAWAVPLELLPVDDLRAQFEVNTVAQHAVTQALLPSLRAARGTIINVSSIGGQFSAPGNGAYSASKFALEALSDALRVELAPFGVRVVLIEPAASRTDIWETSTARVQPMLDAHAAGEYALLLRSFAQLARRQEASGFPPRRFAALVARILATPRPHARYAIPPYYGALLAVARFVPARLRDAMMRRALHW